MEQSKELQVRLQELEGKVIKLEGKVYVVQKVNYYQSRFYLYCGVRTFVKYANEFERFLDAIEITQGAEPWRPNPDQIHTIMSDKIENAPEVREAENAITTVSGGLVNMFNKLQENPSEADLKSAGMMVSIANTLISAGQLQINLLKAKRGV